MKSLFTSKIFFFYAIPLVLLLSFIPFFEDPFIPIRSFVLAFVLLIFFALKFKNKAYMKYHFSFWLFIFLAVFSLISTSYATNVSLALLASSNYFLFGLAFLFFFNINETQNHAVLKSFVFCAVLLNVFLLYEIAFNSLVQINNIESFSYLNSPLGHKNISAAALVLLLPVLFYSLLKFSNFFKILSVCSILSSVFLILILQSRSSYLALISFVIFITAYFIVKQNKLIIPKFISKWSILFAVAVLVLFVVFNPFNLEFINIGFKRLASIFSFNENFSDANKTIYERMFLWKGSLNIIKENFFFGIGAGNWKIEFPFNGLLYSRAEQGKIIFQRPHNDFLWVFSEMGVFAFLAYIAIFLTAIITGFKKIFFNNNYKQNIMLLFSCSAIILFFIISNFSFPKERAFLMLIFVFYLANIFRNNPSSKEIGVSSFAKNAFIFILLIFVFSVNAFRLHSQFHIYKAQQASTKQDWEKGIKHYQQANNIFYNTTSTATPVKWFEAVLWSNLEIYIKAKDCFQVANQINPSHLLTLNNLASSYEILGNHKLAKETYYSALQISPMFYEAIINLSSIHFKEKEFDAAFYVLSKVQAHQNIMDESYFNNLEIVLKAIIIQLHFENKISDEAKENYLKNMNYLKTSFVKSGPNYTNFVKIITE
ncbi:MAG: O-antigen ligase family protein [Chitinophagales bacterium]